MPILNQRVVVTGAAGFIGSHLVEELVALGAKVTALVRYNSNSNIGNLELLPKSVRSEVEIVFGNIEDFHFVSNLLKNKDVVFHLAALIGIPYSYVAPASYVRTNIEGTVNILEAVRLHGLSKMIHTSTSESYGTALYVPIDEKHPQQAQSPYAATKIAADKMVESYHRSFNLPVCTLRPFNTFGPRQSARAIVPTIISQALYSNFIQVGSLTPFRDLLYVKDTVDAFIRISQSKESIGKIVHVGSGSGVNIQQLADLILNIMNCKKEIKCSETRVRPAGSEVFELLCDAQTAKNTLNWQPSVKLNDGLVETIEFVKEHPERFQQNQYVI